MAIRKSEVDCEICGFAPRLEDANWMLHYHHIIPRQYGGNDSIGNKMRVCPTCHRCIHLLINRGTIEVIGLIKEMKRISIKCVREYYNGQLIRKGKVRAVNAKARWDASMLNSDNDSNICIGEIDGRLIE